MVVKLATVNTKAYGKAMHQEKLSINDWLRAAFRALTKGGPAAIKAEAIARDLGVSKGSFYWHFANVPTLKSKMISHWKDEATQSIITELNQVSEDPRDKLKHLVLISTSANDTPYGGPMVEVAIRDWARYDSSICGIVERVDGTRIDYVGSLFQQFGLCKKQSKSSAKILYSSLIGLQILSVNNLANPREDLSELLEILLSNKSE